MIDLQTSNVVRTGLLIAIGAVILLLLIRWNDYQEQFQPELSTNTILSTTDSDTPVAPSDADTTTNVADVPTIDEPQPVTVAAPIKSQHVHVVTDTMDVLIDTHGGDIVKVALRKFATKLGETNNPFILLNYNESQVYVSQSGLIGTNGTDLSSGRPIYQVEKTSYTLAPNQESVQIDLQLQQGGVHITKRFVFHRGNYLADVQYLVNNQSEQPWSARFYGQIKRDDHNPTTTSSGIFAAGANYYGAAITAPDKPYEKYDFEEIADKEFSQLTQTGGWIAMIQHYFVSAWIPQADVENTYSMQKLSGINHYLLRFIGPNNTVQPGQSAVISNHFYAGPKDVDRMQEIAPNLEKTVDFGWLYFISEPLFHFLKWIHKYVGNWGWAIVILVICVKAAFFHLSAAGYRSMAKMKKFAPKMAELKERYGDNRQKFSEEMMKLYKKEKVNPMGGCLPMLLQMPVFLGLYWTLMEVVELRHAPFILWIDDLSYRDPYFVLPLLYGATFFLQQKLSPTPTDPTQARIMQMMPIMFTFMFLFFPSGLVLYWFVNGLLGIAQQYYISKSIEKADQKAATT